MHFSWSQTARRLLVTSWVLVAWVCVGCDDDKSGFGNLNADVDCGNLGPIPTTSQQMDGYFTFGGTDRYPLTASLDVSDRSFSGETRITDANATFAGDCSGNWSESGTLTGSCTLHGTYTLYIDLTGNIGQNGGCGDWVNQSYQSGDWVLAPSE